MGTQRTPFAQSGSDARTVFRETLQPRLGFLDLLLQRLEMRDAVAGERRLLVEQPNLRLERGQLDAQPIELGLNFGLPRDLRSPAFFEPSFISQLGLA